MVHDNNSISDIKYQLTQLQKGFLWLLFIGCSFLVFNIGGYNSFVPANLILPTRLSIVVIIFISTFILYRNKRGLLRYWDLSFSFLISAIGLLFAYFLGRWYLLIPGLSTGTVEGTAIAKVAEVLPIVVSILVGVWIAEKDFTPAFIRGGNIRKSMKLGVVASLVAFIPFLLMGGLGLTATPIMILQWLPWMFVFGFSNAFMEELMIRGIFLRKYGVFFGDRTSLLLTSVIFMIFHQAIIGFTDIISFSIFMVMTFCLGLIWGYVMQKSDSIWGSVFAHMVADILLILVVFGVG